MKPGTRAAVLVVLAIAACSAVWFLARQVDAPSVAATDPALADEIKRLRRENAELRERLERRPRVRAEPPPAARVDPADAPVAESAPALLPGLRMRVEGGGVALVADEAAAAALDAESVADLLAKLRKAVASGRAAEASALENALVRRGAESVDSLMTLVRDTSEPDAVRDAALRALALLPAPGLASLVENLYLSAKGDGAASAARRALALRAAVGADPDAVIPVVQRLLWSSDPADRATAISGLAGARDASLLPFMREQVMKPDAGPGAVALSDAIAVLRDRRWSAFQATGAPDTPAAGDIGAAWASKEADMGEVWLELDFEASVAPESLRIHETYNPGAVARVEAVFENGTKEPLWEGRADAEPAPRWFEPPLRAASARVRTIRIVLDTNRVTGWNEIDAVELIGEGRRQWASAARASSSYAEP